MAEIGRSVEGYLFQTEDDAKIAREEIDRINFISSKMGSDNPAAILAVYDRMVQNKTFITPVGQEYMRTLRDYLYKSPLIKDEQIKDIPIVVNYTEALKSDEEKARERRQKNRRVKTFKKEYKISLGIIAALIAVVISMFIIALNSDNPNILNYKTALENQYASWEQELSEREARIREREDELGIYD
ncbi:MAG: hypothetical protein K5931_08830 [Lachnospiraceae bacterium]|nr:hypothetical protein [Lachnospiraceae bacterium]